MLTRLLLALVVSGVSFASEEAQGPFCWAGQDEHGSEKFIPCHRTMPPNLPILDLDAAPEGVKVCGSGQCLTVSREQFLVALEGWRKAEKHAKP